MNFLTCSVVKAEESADFADRSRRPQVRAFRAATPTAGPGVAGAGGDPDRLGAAEQREQVPARTSRPGRRGRRRRRARPG